MWKKSTFCRTDTPMCVEVEVRTTKVLVRDSKNLERGALIFSYDEWKSFIDGVKAGEFDLK